MANRWSTSEAPRAAQFERWRELICQAFLDLTPESDLRGGFAGTVTQRPLGDLSIARIDSQRQQVRRTARDIAHAPQHGYYANLQLRGTSLMTQDGRSTVLRPGDIALVDATEPFAFDFRDDFSQLSLYVPKPLLDSQLNESARTATGLATTTGLGAAIRHSLLALSADDLPEATATRLAIHTCGIIAVAISQPMTDPATPMRHDRLHTAALADIDEHLTDDDLSPPATARRLGVSVRLLYAVFAGRERGFAAEVRLRRLDRAWHDLQDPSKSHLRVIDVAVEAGFTDVTSFHRAFRCVYGHTPAHLRSTTR
jgi:AraC family transcriptional activator of tynA and feaB